jgi:hypothetical protein
LKASPKKSPTKGRRPLRVFLILIIEVPRFEVRKLDPVSGEPKWGIGFCCGIMEKFPFFENFV